MKRLLLVFALIVTMIALACAADDRVDELIEKAEEIRNYLESYMTKSFEAASVLGNSSELAELVVYSKNARLDDVGVIRQIWQYISDKKVALGVDRITIVNHEGMTLSRSHDLHMYGDNVLHVPSIAAGLRGETRSFFAATPRVPVVIQASSPIVDGDQIVGGLALDFDTGTNEFLNRMGETFGVEATVFWGPTAVAASSASSYALRHEVTPHVVDIVLRQGLGLILEDYYAYYFPLRDIFGSPAGIFLVELRK